MKKRTTIHIDAVILKAAKIKAMQDDTNLSAVIEKLLKEYAKSK